MSVRLRHRCVRKRRHVHPQPSKDSPPTLQQPLSLQQSSTNCIVTNLEKYPPAMLALLPLHFRRELILLLPPADIFQLEQTKIVEGIDMDNEIWKVVSERYDYKVGQSTCYENIWFTRCMTRRTPISRNIVYSTQLSLPYGIELHRSSNSTDPISWRAHFVSVIVSFLFCLRPFVLTELPPRLAVSQVVAVGYRNYIIFLQLLFCTQFYKLKQLTNVGGFPLQVSGVTLLPSRYSRFFTSSVPLSDLVRFLLEDCHMQPLDINVDLEHFNIESLMSSASVILFHLFLSSTKKVTLFVKPSFILALRKGTNLGDAIALDKLRQLCDMLALSQLECVSFETVASSARGYIYKTNYDKACFNSILHKCFLHPLFVNDRINSDHFDLFRGLRQIDITSFNVVEIELSTLCSLLVFTQNRSFESISVTGPIVSLCVDEQEKVVFQALENFFTTPISPSCSQISLRDMKQVPFSFLFWWIKLFFFSPSTILQKMIISSCEVPYSRFFAECNNEMISIPANPADLISNSHKSLHLLDVDLGFVFVDELTSLPFLVLDELHIDHTLYLNYETSPTYSLRDSVLCSLFSSLPTIPVCHIKLLSIQLEVTVSISPATSKSNFIGMIFELAQKLPVTAISLQSRISSQHVDTLLACLHNEWKKRNHSGNVYLNQLLIQLSDSLDEIHNLLFHSSLQKSLVVYSINKIARNVDIK